MPATLVTLHCVPSVSIALEDLSNAERSVALYVSDMPDRYRYRRGDDALLESWIIQGATLLGLERLYRLAALLSGYQLAWMEKCASTVQEQAHAQRFPKTARLDRAGRMASLVSLNTPMSEAARARGLRPQFDGGCPTCEGSGQVWERWIAPGCDWEEEGYQPCPMCPGPVNPVRCVAVAA
ncbi:hypothetical protein [Streptomyces sp. b84]|uniref:hypothetical protein n=1 Tax=Streptomyces sp. b84 TaxID=1827631 RepID=UPI000BF00AD7|nr:hypothetical protein [Streptomyces sp. b84]